MVLYFADKGSEKFLGCNECRSVAGLASRSSWLSAQRYSIATFSPST
jgi:hypothetical protein